MLSINYYMFQPLVLLQVMYVRCHGRCGQCAQYLMIVERPEHVEVYIPCIVYQYRTLC
jgi:hypothetical protein